MYNGGARMPGIGFKTKLDWEFFEATNGGESVGLNFLDIPFLFEYCLGYHEGVAAPHAIAGSSTTTTFDHPELNYTHVITVTRGPGYDPGGYPVSRATFIYFGPQICDLFKSFHDTPSGNTSPITDPNLRSTYVGLVGGFTFWINYLNLDLSYQKGLQSIYTGKDVYINGFIFKIGVNFSRRIFNY